MCLSQGLDFKAISSRRFCKMSMVGGWDCTRGRQHKYLPFSSRGLLWPHLKILRLG